MGKRRLLITTTVAYLLLLKLWFLTFMRGLENLESFFLGYIDGLADAVEQGLVKSVGVSNYSGKFLDII